MDEIFILLMSSLLMSSLLISMSVTGVVPEVHVVPQGIVSVNGSDINMGCASPLVDRGGVMLCNSESYLVDNCSPTIDTSTSNWASQLVTLRGHDGDNSVERVLLSTFVFDTAVSLDRIELDMFLCPEWNIGASYIEIYADDNSTLVYSDKSTHIEGYFPESSSCDSLSPAIVSFGDVQSSLSYHTWHIIVDTYSDFYSDIEWVYVGEVRFLEEGSTPTPNSCSTEMAACTPTIITIYPNASATLLQLEPTSVPDGRNDMCNQQQPSSVPECSSSPKCSSSALIGVSAASLLVTVTLTIIIITQCLLMVRMRKSKDVTQSDETYTEVMTPTTMQSDVQVTPNEVYAFSKITNIIK